MEGSKKHEIILMLGHLCSDINQGALPAILPFLVVQRGMNYASVAGLVFASNMLSSVIQPVLGYLGDKKPRPWLMSLGIALAGAGIALIGFCASPWQMYLAAMVSGIGIATFHPEGGKNANYAAGKNKGSGIGIFSVGGNLGFAIGPIIAATGLSMFGMSGTILFLVPTLLMALVILFFLPSFKEMAATHKQGGKKKAASGKEDDWGSFAKSVAVMFTRSIVYYALLTFIPLYFIGRFGLTEGTADARLTLFSLVGAAATLVGGGIADRVGYVKVVRGCFCAIAPSLLILLLAPQCWLASLMVIPLACGMNGAHSTAIAMAQSHLPNRISLASGITLGMCVSVGGICAPGFGWIGDTYGLNTAMLAILAVAVLTGALSFILPESRQD